MLNHTVIMGRLTRDPELRRTNSGVSVASFALAVERDFKGKNGEKETDFIDCTAWREKAEFASKYFSKGSMAVVSGRLQMKSWTDKDGDKRTGAEVVVENIYFGESKQRSGGPPAAESAPNHADQNGTSTPNHVAQSSYAAPAPYSDFPEIDGNDDVLPF